MRDRRSGWRHDVASRLRGTATEHFSPIRRRQWITGAGIVAPLVTLVPGVNRELLVLATGAGSLILSHVNDAGFWLVKQYFNMTVVETFKTWTLMETLLSVVGIILIMILSVFV